MSTPHGGNGKGQLEEPEAVVDMTRQDLATLCAHLLGAVDAIERMLGKTPTTAEIRRAYRANRPGTFHLGGPAI